MHNINVNFVKNLDICKKFAENLVNEHGNLPRRDPVPRFSDLEVNALSLMAESLSIDSENNLFVRLREYRDKMPNLISRRQFNNRRKTTSQLCESIRMRIAENIEGGEEFFCVDSKPIPVCCNARAKRCVMGANDYDKAPAYGYCASQQMFFYGYKPHALCGLSGVIYSSDLSKGNVHDIHYLKDLKWKYSYCTFIGDKGVPQCRHTV